MKRTITLFTLLFVLAAFMSVKNMAQKQKHDHKCGNTEMKKHLDKILSKDPLLQHSFEQAKDRLKTNRVKSIRSEPYIIPIVFHIIHNYGVENISDAKVYEALDIINEDYSATNSDFNDLKSEFTSVAGNPNVIFKLAQKDPDGNPTTGITRTVSNLTVNGSWDYPEVKRLSSWPREKYLNVWIVRSSNGSNGSAWAYLPYQVDNDSMYDLDGIIISSWAFGATTQGYHRILTHEIGHVFNLYHTWSPWKECGDAEACNEDDEIHDTPNCSGYYGGCNINHSSCGSLDMIQNYMDYSKCPVAFTNGQIARMHACLNSDVSDRNNLWTEANLQATLFDKATARLLLKNKEILENEKNNGAFTEKYELELLDAQFSNIGIVNSSQYKISGFPTNLTPEVKVLSPTSMEIKLTGNANNHSKSNNTENASIQFSSNSLISGGTTLYNETIQFSIRFRDPYEIIYTNCNDITINSTNTWKWLNLGPDDASYGIWYDNGNLRIESYTKPMVCQESNKNISVINHEEVISPSSNWVDGGAYPDEHYLCTSSYTNWKGKTAYAGVRFTGINSDEILYGWLRLSVAADGNSFTLLDYAYNEAPNTSIKAGQKDNSLVHPELLADKSAISENPITNNGSIDENIALSIIGDNQFALNGVLSSSDFTVKNLPDGLSVEIEIADNKHARIAFNQSANNHSANHSCNLSIHLHDHVFANSNINTQDINLAMNFIDPYKIIYVNCEDLVASSSQTWTHFTLKQNSQEYGVWYHEGKLRLESYSKPIVCQKNTTNIIPLAKNTLINSELDYWETGGAYPNEHYFTNSDYSIWNGQTAYVGFSFKDDKNYDHYGWFRVKVEADQSAYTLLDYAYHQAPKQGIYAGSTTNNVPVIKVNFTCDNKSISLNEEINYTAQCNSNNNIVEWIWTFEGGDPSTYSGKNPPAISYNTVGDFDVSLKITDNKGNTVISNKTDFISVSKPVSTNYCIPKMNKLYSGLYISKVEINSNSYKSNEDKYSDYTNTIFPVSKNSSNVIRVTPSTEWSDNYIIAWIDWNKDGIFDDASEKILLATNGYWTYGTAFSVPNSVESGYTRMRIRICYYNSKLPCQEENYMGEVEDYTISISGTKNSRLIANDQLPDEIVKLYPNPAHNYFTIEAPINSSIRIYDQLGKLRIQQNFKNQITQFSTKGFSSGIYIIHIITKNNTIKKQLIISK